MKSVFPPWHFTNHRESWQIIGNCLVISVICYRGDSSQAIDMRRTRMSIIVKDRKEVLRHRSVSERVLQFAIAHRVDWFLLVESA